MSDIHSTVTDLPRSCKSVAEHMTHELEKEDAFAFLTDDCCKQMPMIFSYVILCLFQFQRYCIHGITSRSNSDNCTGGISSHSTPM